MVAMMAMEVLPVTLLLYPAAQGALLGALDMYARVRALSRALLRACANTLLRHPMYRVMLFVKTPRHTGMPTHRS